MKTLNEDIRRRILHEAKQAFEREGYLNASIRDIARRTGISPGNIYNYFDSKDKLFRAVVQPAIYRLELMLEEHHGIDGADIKDMVREDYLRSVTDEFILLIRKHRSLLSILLFKAQGSSLETFKEKYTDRATEQVELWLDHAEQRHKDIDTTVSKFFLHFSTVSMFTLIEEIIMHNIHGSDLEKAMEEYTKFEIYGWKNMFNI